MSTCLKRGLFVAVFLTAIVFYNAPAEAQRPDSVSVFIGFHVQPGAAEENLVRAAGGQIRYTYSIVPAIAASVPENAISGLMTNPRVSRVELVRKIHAVDHGVFDGGDEYDAVWGVEHIRARTAHGISTGLGVTVAVIDSGIDCVTHPFELSCVGGEDFVSSSYDGSCVYDSSSSYGSSPTDDNGHGTHVAGSVAAVSGNGDIVGAAPEANLVALKVLNQNGSGSFDDVVCALNWISTYNSDPITSPKIRVTNNSYGADGDPGQTVYEAFLNTYESGVMHIAAAGNNGTGGGFPGGGPFGGGGSDNTMIYPARYDIVVAVAATDDTDARASFSSVGAEMELAAPGVNIFSTEPDGNFGTKSGTSMASPHVAGVAALLFSMKSGTSPDIVRATLRSTADETVGSSSDGWDKETGYGLVDAAAAVGADGATNSPPSVYIDSPTGGTVSGETPISAVADDADGSVVQVEFFVDGSPIGTDKDGSNGWSVGWDACTTPDGSHSLTATATDDGDPAASTTSESVSVNVDCSGSDGGSVFFGLTATGTKNRGDRRVDLDWQPYDGAAMSFYVFRDGENIDTVGAENYTDTSAKGNGLTYWVCEVGGGACSEQVTVNF